MTDRAETSRTRTLLAIAGGGASVALVGLSQILAIGALSLAPLGSHLIAAGVIAAFVTATLGGAWTAIVGRAPGHVSGPRTSIAIIYAALCADLVARAGTQVDAGSILAQLSVAVVLMGVLQAIAGGLRLGDAVRFLPFPVTSGFITGIGLLILWSQVAPLLGLEGPITRYEWAQILQQTKPLAILVGAVSALAVWLTPRIAARGQPLLVPRHRRNGPSRSCCRRQS